MALNNFVFHGMKLCSFVKLLGSVQVNGKKLMSCATELNLSSLVIPSGIKHKTLP